MKKVNLSPQFVWYLGPWLRFSARITFSNWSRWNWRGRNWRDLVARIRWESGVFCHPTPEQPGIKRMQLRISYTKTVLVVPRLHAQKCVGFWVAMSHWCGLIVWHVCVAIAAIVVVKACVACISVDVHNLALGPRAEFLQGDEIVAN